MVFPVMLLKSSHRLNISLLSLPTMDQVPLNSKNLRILQWNCRSFIQWKGHLQLLSHDFDVLLLCETWLLPGEYAGLSGFTITRRDRTSPERGGGVAICLRNSIPFSLVDIYFSPHNLVCIAAFIQTLQGDLLLVSVYRPPSALSSTLHFHNLLQPISSYNSILLAGDFNGHHLSCSNPVENIQLEYQLGFQLDIHLES